MGKRREDNGSESGQEERLDEEIRTLMEDYTEEDRAFLEELWDSIREFNQ